MSKEYINFGTLVKAKDKDAFGRIQYYISLNENVKLTVNGKEVTKKSISAQGMESKFESMINSGKFDEATVEEMEKKKERYGKDGDLNFVKQEFTVVVGD